MHVISVRKEIRARRAEDHIVLLRAELDRSGTLTFFGEFYAFHLLLLS